MANYISDDELRQFRSLDFNDIVDSMELYLIGKNGCKYNMQDVGRMVFGSPDYSFTISLIHRCYNFAGQNGGKYRNGCRFEQTYKYRVTRNDIEDFVDAYPNGTFDTGVTFESFLLEKIQSQNAVYQQPSYGQNFQPQQQYASRSSISQSPARQTDSRAPKQTYVPQQQSNGGDGEDFLQSQNAIYQQPLYGQNFQSQQQHAGRSSIRQSPARQTDSKAPKQTYVPQQQSNGGDGEDFLSTFLNNPMKIVAVIILAVSSYYLYIWYKQSAYVEHFFSTIILFVAAVQSIRYLFKRKNK